VKKPRKGARKVQVKPPFKNSEEKKGGTSIPKRAKKPSRNYKNKKNEAGGGKGKNKKGQ